jgi:hypothetical protein
MNKIKQDISCVYYYILSTYKFIIHVLQICHTAWTLLPHTSGRFFPIFKIPWTVNRAFLPAVWFYLPSCLLFFYCKSLQCLLPDGFLNEEFLCVFSYIFQTNIFPFLFEMSAPKIIFKRHDIRHFLCFLCYIMLYQFYFSSIQKFCVSLFITQSGCECCSH